MTDIDVVRHGKRWAVQIAGDTKSEHATVEAAVLEAKRLGSGEPTVHEQDPTGLDRVEADAGERADAQPGPTHGRSGDLPQRNQAGL